MTRPGPARVLLVNPVRAEADEFARLVHRVDGWTQAAVEVVDSLEAAIAACTKTSFDVVCISDGPPSDGPGMVPDLCRAAVDVPVIVLIAGSAERAALPAMRAGAADCLSTTDLTTETLAEALRRALTLGGGWRERHALEVQLRQSQKMEAIGRLAGGIAHDFNNLLTAILGYCNLMLEEMPGEDPLRRDLEEIRKAGLRAATLTRHLLAFGRRQTLQPQIVDLDGLIGRSAAMLRRLLDDRIELVTALSAGASGKVDPASIEQVLVLLASNARDAMPAGGRLAIETVVREFDAPSTREHVEMAPGRYVQLAVHDTGVGMDRATVARAFEPFFTTKGQGRGVGLGLATVYGIVKQSGGYVWVYSEPGQGTVFKVYLPVAQPAAGTRPGAPPQAEAGGGAETVLIVEDEDAVRALAGQVLRRHGYVSGYTDRSGPADQVPADARILEKPFAPSDLARAVRRVLSSPA